MALDRLVPCVAHLGILVRLLAPRPHLHNVDNIDPLACWSYSYFFDFSFAQRFLAISLKWSLPCFSSVALPPFFAKSDIVILDFFLVIFIELLGERAHR